MYKIEKFIPREYQKNIHETIGGKNTLVCLPTGTGKTKLAIMLLIERLNEYPESNVVVISPTKPLSSQIAKEIKESTNIPSEEIVLLTGTTKPQERSVLFSSSKVIVATPQTIQFDLKNKRVSLKNTSLLVVDECHRSKENFANTIVAKEYHSQAKNELILALTASPGATKEKVSEVCANLFIKNIELRTEEDEDLSGHIQQKESQNIKVKLPEKFQKIQGYLRSYYLNKAAGLKRYGIQKPPSAINKTDLLMYQRGFQTRIKNGDFIAYRGVSEVAEMIKVSHALGLLETQTPRSLKGYFEKLKSESSKASKSIVTNKLIEKCIELTSELVDSNEQHPKFKKLLEILEEEYKKNPKVKTIIFANYRSTVNEIKDGISGIKNINPAVLVGQKNGVTQKDQLATLSKFNNNEFNALVCTSIGEEGISIGSLDIAIFYDHTASEIRKIQRSGRVARIKPGKIINLIAEKTLDEAMLWTAKRKEVKMHNLLSYMKRDLNEDNS